MPTPATVTAGGTAQTTKGDAPRQPIPVVPFIRASAEHREPAGVDISRQISTSDQDLGVFDVPAYGYLRSILLVVEATGGSGAGVTSADDGPWTALKGISLSEPNGATIVQFNTGYELYLVNKYGGYRWASDPKRSPVFSAIAGSGGNFTYVIRIPVELSLRDGLGSLPNQNAAATFKLRLTLAKASEIYGVVPGTTLPTVRVRAYMEAWDQPLPSDNGVTNQTTPPAVNTTQYWSVQSYAVPSGSFNVRLTRMGNYIRNLIFILRRTAGTRANGDADFPDPISLYLDTRPIDTVSKAIWKHTMWERYGFTGTAEAADALDNGVFAYDLTHEFAGKAGMETRDLWLPTLGSTRLELGGSWGNAGTLTVLTNDVSVAGSVFL